MNNSLNTLKSVLIAAAGSIAFILSACSYSKELSHNQIFVGLNGPRTPGIFIFESREAVDKSWLKKALTRDEYELILSKVDFSHQLLLTVAAGERTGATGKVNITHVKQLEVGKSFPIDVSALVGMVDDKCARQGLVSYPFALSTLEKIDNLSPSRGMDIGNFSDGCALEKAGEANAP